MLGPQTEAIRLAIEDMLVLLVVSGQWGVHSNVLVCGGEGKVGCKTQ